MARDIPRFISVDDHVVEPPHLFQRWLPKKCADDPRSPRVERRGIGKMTYKGGTTYEIEWDDSQPQVRHLVLRGARRSRTSATSPRSGSRATR